LNIVFLIKLLKFLTICFINHIESSNSL